MEQSGWRTAHFNPRSPRGERPPTPCPVYQPKDFNPRSPRGERLFLVPGISGSLAISIHAPREGSDAIACGEPILAQISIHAPREGSDRGVSILSPISLIFQSTLPARGATYGHTAGPAGDPISIHAPREGSDHNRPPIAPGDQISIHAPREGSDSGSRFSSSDTRFQSTLPARGATANVHRFLDKICTVCIKNRAFFAQCLIQTTSNAESVGKTRCYFGANLQAFIDSLYFALLQNQHFFWHIRGFASKMLYFVFVMVPKIIET